MISISRDWGMEIVATESKEGVAESWKTWMLVPASSSTKTRPSATSTLGALKPSTRLLSMR